MARMDYGETHDCEQAARAMLLGGMTMNERKVLERRGKALASGMDEAFEVHVLAHHSG